MPAILEDEVDPALAVFVALGPGPERRGGSAAVPGAS